MKPYIILALLVVLAYANSLQNEFVWDDHFFIEENPKINLSIKEMPSVFATPLLKVEGLSAPQQVYYKYRPILSLFFILNYKVWGTNPLGFHLSNLLLHLIIVMVIYRMGLLLFNNDKLISIIGASIFAVHPVHNEPVGRAAGGEVIFGFFTILSIYFFLKEKNYLSWLTFSLALLSKETSVMLPFALVILTIHKHGFKKGIIAMIPYIILVGVYIIIRTMVVDVVLGVNLSQSTFTQIVTIMTAAFDYIRLLIIPYPLSPYYHARWYTSITEPRVIIAIIVLTSVSFFIFSIRKDKTMLFLLAFPFIMLAPVIWKVNAFVIGMDQMYIAERFLYVPAMLFALFVSAYAGKLFNESSRTYLAAVWIFVVSVFAIITIFSNRLWKDDIVLFQKIVAESPDTLETAFAHVNLGAAYSKQNRFDDAIKEYLIALRLNPYSAPAYNNLGSVYHKQRRYDAAINEYLTALELNPDFADAHNNLGLAYSKQDRFDEAINEFMIALKLKPNYAETHSNLGMVYYKQRMLDKAMDEYLTALKLRPDDATSYYSLGLIYYKQGRFDEAISEYLMALKIKPDYVEAHYNLGYVYKQMGLKDKARDEFETVLRLSPNNPKAIIALQSLHFK